jgi:malic enzyme
MEKVIKDGKVAVLVSKPYGAGFHTWGAPVEAIFDPILVDLIENQKIQDAIDYVKKTYPDVYVGGVKDLDIEWIPAGTKFIINEYDGSESLQLMDDTNWLTA